MPAAPPTAGRASAALDSAALGAFAFLVLLTAWRVAVLFDHAPNLSFDEAQYWGWAQDLGFGYYSKPPMVAWAIAATTAACGDGEACVKLSAPFAYLFTGVFLYLFAARLFSRRIAFWSAVTFAVLPAVSLSAMVISTDPFMLAFWAAALWLLARALDDADRALPWLALGVVIGLGLLAKYTMLAFLASTALYLAWSPAHRRLLRGRAPWLVLAAAFLVYSPNLAWNIGNGFASYLHTKDNANLAGNLLNPGKMAEFVGAQFAVFGPLLFGALLVLLSRARRLVADDRMRLLLAFTVPMLAAIVVQSLLSRANANWAAPAYVAGTVLVVAWAMERDWSWLLKASLLLHLTAAALLYNYDAALRATGLDSSARYDLLKKVRGWNEIGRHLSDLWQQRHPNAVVMADERKLLATLLYYMRPHPLNAVKWNPSGQIRDHYDLTTDVAKAGDEFLFVTEEPSAAHVAPYFAEVRELAGISYAHYPDRTHGVRVYYLKGFRGYPPKG